ncbi:hypothetical protein QLQ12_25330 [Actinoplanes sp. NEAU-A12]|uniref:Uncharacterized protein n=1 Tax=Actinoplanes sandaracinus TaxID=3045177 RepID=A0ABT6WQN0_9ACTN|nr:hypothetical protein [Actinoplanes sandaracinus]MDI6101945.1 hypothetical protein [Actinoplanes sandaracinus]
MQKTRRIGAVVALATAAFGMATTVAAAPATAAPQGPQPVSNWLQSVRANTGSWVTIHWRTDRRICDAEVRVRGERVRVDYVGFRRSASFSRGDSLRPGRSDFTRVRVTPFAQRPGVAKLWATISYDECGFKARTQTRTAVLSLPVLRNTGPGGYDGPGGPGHGQPGGPGHHNGSGTPGYGGPGQGGPGQYTPGGGQGGPGLSPNGIANGAVSQGATTPAATTPPAAAPAATTPAPAATTPAATAPATTAPGNATPGGNGQNGNDRDGRDRDGRDRDGRDRDGRDRDGNNQGGQRDNQDIPRS